MKRLAQAKLTGELYLKSLHIVSPCCFSHKDWDHDLEESVRVLQQPLSALYYAFREAKIRLTILGANHEFQDREKRLVLCTDNDGTSGQPPIFQP